MSVDFYRYAGPLLRRLPAETAHRLAIRALSLGLPACLGRAAPSGVASDGVAAARLRQCLWGLDFPNPVGLAAGFDKNGEVWRQALSLGFGFVEIGSVTPQPQPGNPLPRLFRLPQAEAVINRMGFNNAGAEAMARLLAGRNGDANRRGILGINLGKNKTTEDAAADYEIGIRRLAPFADYLVINVSSPNTPGLRALQGRAPLQELIRRSRQALTATVPGKAPPLLLKIAPDLTSEDLADIAAVALEDGPGGAAGLDGLIVSNTTITRPAGIDPVLAKEAGGLSGRPLFPLSTEILRQMYRLTEGRLPIIGVGGISNAAEAYAKIRAGASLVQLYSALVYQGPALVARINRDLVHLLAKDGFDNVSAAIGADHRA
jgi:dihydroorotate dehydrogenase